MSEGGLKLNTGETKIKCFVIVLYTDILKWGKLMLKRQISWSMEIPAHNELQI